MDRVADHDAPLGLGDFRRLLRRIPAHVLETALSRPAPFAIQIVILSILLLLVTAFGLVVHDTFRLTPVLVCLFVSTSFSLFTTVGITFASSFLFSLVADFLFIDQPFHLELDIHFVVRVIVFVSSGLLTNLMARALRQAYALSDSARRSAEAANREKDDILAILAHDLRAPLTAAQLSLQLIERQAPAAADGAAVLRHTIRARDACRRVNSLVLDLLDSAKAAAGGITVNLETHDVAALALGVCDELRVIAAQTGVFLECDAAPPIVARCDANRFSQLLSNLVGNAVKFTPRGGTVTVSLLGEPASLLLRVADTGIGMTEEQRRHVFERFWQAEGSRRTGVGLGLFIVKAIVDAHGGTISVESAPNRGTSFTVRLPA